MGALIPHRGEGEAAPNGKMLKSILLYNRSFDLAKILHDDTYEDPRTTEATELEPEVEFRRQGRFSNLVLGHIFTSDQDIFTKLGVYVDNGVPQRAEWSKYAFLHNPRWRMAAILNYLNRHNSATDFPIWLKFRTTTHMKVPAELRTSKLEQEVEFCRQRAFFRISFWGMLSLIKIFSPALVYAKTVGSCNIWSGPNMLS